MKVIKVLLIGILLSSCNNSIEEDIHKKSNSIWYIFEQETTTLSNYGFKFYSDNSFYYGRYDYPTKSFMRYNPVDHEQLTNWNCLDSIMFLGNRQYHIIKFSKDTLFLKHIKTSHNLVLVNISPPASAGSITPKMIEVCTR